ncbi:MAG: oxidoreductase [Nocardia sp.]|uniref:carboxylic acid reductase n=1 Tax=Nocardia sp. TaxID=1821 RepID=UPI00260865B9|nr:carboxylic acid reductase [Nocardia sp.]MCU1648825.1 oxidoreductase [Nocardia sp.]
MTRGALQLTGEQRAAAVLADDQVRAAMPLPAVTAAVCRPGLRQAEVVATVMEGYADRPALGERAAELITDGTGRRVRSLLPRYDTVSYGELWARVGALSVHWRDNPVCTVRGGEFVCTLGFVSTDYVTVDLACVHLGAVAVPLQANGTVAQWNSILDETSPRVLATSLELLGAAVEAVVIGTTAPGRLLVFDYHPEDDYQRETFESARRRLTERGRPVVLETLAEAVDRGRSLPAVAPHLPDTDEDPLALLVYTSGSTGAPKGAMYSDRLATTKWLFGTGRQLPRITFSYMPLSHAAGRTTLSGTFVAGGTAYLAAASDMSTLFDDLALVRPTELFFVPRVCEMLFQRYLTEIDGRMSAGEHRADAEEAVQADLREKVLGGRHLLAYSASAPLSAEIRAFMESTLGIELRDGYSSTETGGGVLIDSRIRRPPVIEYKLADVPELGYFRTDKPHPRGELLLKTTTMFGGYYRRPEITAEVFDEEGFYRTGDVMAEVAPDHLVYLDRRNNVLKLSQGEFVTVAKLEAAYSTSPLIRQIFIYGSSERAYLLAVVVPTEAAVAVADPIGALSESLQQIARRAELNSYEIPRDFLVETVPFSADNGLLSAIGKPLRPNLKERYGERLEQLYTELGAQQADELQALRGGSADRPVLQTVGLAVRALLGRAGTTIDFGAHFTDLGGDSLSALSLSTLLREIFEIEVPVGVIVGPTTDLRHLADYIETERTSGGTRPTAASVHGRGIEIRAADLTLDKFLDGPTLAQAAGIPQVTEPATTVLLTGANGYLGRFLCMEWLQRLDNSKGTLICLLRGSDAATARQRLNSVFDTGDPDLLRRFRTLADRRLRVLVGDIGEPNFGLGEQEWHELADTVDLIVHAAALVNHVLPYEQLFGPNVTGTAEVIRLALTTRRKPVSFLSSVAVAGRQERKIFTEDGDIRQISPVRSLGDDYAGGYGSSKWAGEVLLHEAHDRFGLPVTVFRSDMILAHSRFAGQLNLPDRFTRLLLSLIATGIAPKSFYETDSDGNRRRAHYDGLPADFTAAAITVLGAEATTGFHAFDVLNPHDDGLSLDEFVDWLIESGEVIIRIDDYSEWLARFETALRALPEHEHQHTMLPLLHSLRHPASPTEGAALPAEKFRAAVRAASVTPDGEIPHLSRELITKYVTDLRLYGLA